MIINIFDNLIILIIFCKTRIAYIFFLKSTDLVRNINHITSYFVSNLVLATLIQRPTSVRWHAIDLEGKRNLIIHRSHWSLRLTRYICILLQIVYTLACEQAHIWGHARKAKSEFKRERSGEEQSGEEARIRSPNFSTEQSKLTFENLVIGEVACLQLVYLFTSHNHVYIPLCKHASRPIRARVLS